MAQSNGNSRNGRSSNAKPDVPPEMIDQLRQLLAQHETSQPPPPRFEPIVGEPEPWSVRPPGGFAELKAKLRKSA